MKLLYTIAFVGFSFTALATEASATGCLCSTSAGYCNVFNHYYVGANCWCQAYQGHCQQVWEVRGHAGRKQSTKPRPTLPPH